MGMLFGMKDPIPGGLRSRVVYKFEREGCKYGLLTKCEVEMAGYWPSSFFACLWTETKSRSINSQKKKKERGQYPAILTDQLGQ